MGAERGTRRTLTTVFTDIEGSTRLWDQFPEVAADTLAHHDRLLRDAFAAHTGVVFQHTGDGLVARFDDPSDAIRGAITAQRALEAADWGEVGDVRVRMGIHVGDVVERPDGLFGWALNACSRLMDMGHGGQILTSGAVLDRTGPEPDCGVTFREVGEYRLRDLPGTTRVLQVEAPGLCADFPPPRTSSPATRPTPQTPTALVGRRAELDDLVDRLDDRRLTTLTGPSGVGKTRLATAAATTLGPHREIVWCDLAGTTDESLVAAVMTQHAVSIRPGDEPMESLVSWLAERPRVVVLDRCDAVRDAVAELAEALVRRRTPVIATSQHTLGVVGEHVVRLGPLQREEAVAMLTDRAAAAGAPAGPAAVAFEIVDLVERLPFAIEVAAARLVAFSPTELRDALRVSGLAAVGRDDLTDSVAQTVMMAVEALQPTIRDRLVAASVCRGSFDSAAFRAVCEPDASDELSATLVELVGASLLQPTELHGRTMYRLLDPVRSVLSTYVDEVPSELAAARLRTHVLDLSGEVASGLRGPNERRWMRVLDRNLDLVRGEFHRALDDADLDTASRLATEQWEWAFFRFNSEYFDWGQKLLDRFDHPDESRLSTVHGVVALGHWFRDEEHACLEHANEALRRERDLGAPFSLPARLALINATVFAGADAPPADVFREADEYQRSRPEGFYRMNVEAQNAIMATWFGQYELAEARATKALKLARESENPSSIAFALWALGQAIEHDDVGWAEQLFDDALRHARDVDNRWVESLVQVALASSRRRTGGPYAAAGMLVELLDQLMRAGHWAQVWNVVRLAALVAGDVGQADLAFQLASATDDADLRFPALPADVAAHEELMRRVRDERGEAWTRRAARIAATWGATDALLEARSGLERIIADAPSDA